MTTIDAFRGWLRHGPIGSKYVYHSGLLAADRERFFTFEGGFHTKKVEPTNTIGNIALNLAIKGKLALVQKRVGPQACDYIAIKRERVHI